MARVLYDRDTLIASGFVGVARGLDDKYNLQGLLGNKVPDDLESNVVQFLGHVLASIGYETKRVKVGQRRYTTVDLDQAAEWTNRRLRAYCRLLGIPVGIDGKRGESPAERQASRFQELRERFESMSAGRADADLCCLPVAGPGSSTAHEMLGGAGIFEEMPGRKKSPIPTENHLPNLE